MSVVEIGWTEDDSEHDARVHVIRTAWHAAYRHIFTRREIDGVFDGDLEGVGSWVTGRKSAVGNLAARRAGELIGLASLGLRGASTGELAALYVVPQEQGRGVGTLLWNRSVAELTKWGCDVIEVWTLARAEAWRFYEARGCRRIAEGTFDLPGHREAAIGYALTLSGGGSSAASSQAR